MLNLSMMLAGGHTVDLPMWAETCVAAVLFAILGFWIIGGIVFIANLGLICTVRDDYSRLANWAVVAFYSFWVVAYYLDFIRYNAFWGTVCAFGVPLIAIAHFQILYRFRGKLRHGY